MGRRHVLIGGGPGALAAAEAIRGADDGAEIIVVGADPHGYYSRPGLAYYLAERGARGAALPLRAGGLRAPRRRACVTERAVGHRPAPHTGSPWRAAGSSPYDRLLIATGSLAIPARVPGAELDGVVKLDDMDDARDIVRRCRTRQGGGGRRRRHHRARDRRGPARPRRARPLLHAQGPLLEQRAVGVRVAHRRAGAARERRGDPSLHRAGRASSAGTAASSASRPATATRIPCDLVAVAIGVRPQIELAEAAGLDCGRGILVDQYLRSSDEDIFAAGDVAEVVDRHSGRRILEVLWNSAVAKGRIAGLNMADGARPRATRRARRSTSPGWPASHHDHRHRRQRRGRRPGGRSSRGDSQTWSELGAATIVEAQTGDAHVRLALGERHIVGAVVMGDQALSFPLQELVEARADVSGIVAAPRLRGAGRRRDAAELDRTARGRGPGAATARA